jgi:hypothetical protein
VAAGRERDGQPLGFGPVQLIATTKVLPLSSIRQTAHRTGRDEGASDAKFPIGVSSHRIP